ncbi:hypothetical protein SSPO_088920 [Streptomyces antimycoticus]|uniref:Uncharacterized protein n=1 Tax=Streptomyces antimycoticus TaxID=68175 RepID=A0A499UW39_9ACTN|nr:hypothetical protein SSPO_088920 [Streptomyces antimycoticus]
MTISYPWMLSEASLPQLGEGVLGEGALEGPPYRFAVTVPGGHQDRGVLDLLQVGLESGRRHHGGREEFVTRPAGGGITDTILFCAGVVGAGPVAGSSPSSGR